MVINPYSMRSSPVPPRKKEEATSTPASSAPVESVGIRAESTPPAKRSLCTRALLGAGAAVALAVAIGGCAPTASPPPPVSVPPLVWAPSYKVSHQTVVHKGTLLYEHRTTADYCSFEGPGGTYIVTHVVDPTAERGHDDDGFFSSYPQRTLSRTITLPGNAASFNLKDLSSSNLTDQSRNTLQEIAAYCDNTEEDQAAPTEPLPAVPPLRVAPIVSGSSYQVSHTVDRVKGDFHTRASITDDCRFRGYDGTYLVSHYRDADGHSRSKLVLPGNAAEFQVGNESPYIGDGYNLTAEGKATLEAIVSFCQQTEQPAGAPQSQFRTHTTSDTTATIHVP